MTAAFRLTASALAVTLLLPGAALAEPFTLVK